MTGSSPAGFGPWSVGISPMERLARLRALRALAMCYCGGPHHPLWVELLAAELDVTALPRALGQLDRLPALWRRRLLASYAALAAASPSPLGEPPRRRTAAARR
jgi:hypothetical protein